MRELLQTLDRRRSYFTITHFAELLRDEQIMIPCDLKVCSAAFCASLSCCAGPTSGDGLRVDPLALCAAPRGVQVSAADL